MISNSQGAGGAGPASVGVAQCFMIRPGQDTRHVVLKTFDERAEVIGFLGRGKKLRERALYRPVGRRDAREARTPSAESPRVSEIGAIRERWSKDLILYCELLQELTYAGVELLPAVELRVAKDVI
jgi:hypothetical protein